MQNLYFLNEIIRTKYPEVLIVSFEKEILVMKDFSKLTEYTVNLLTNETSAKPFGGAIEAETSNEAILNALKVAFEVKKSA